MGFNFLNKDGYNMYDMASMMQKAIRRSDVKHAAFAAKQLFHEYHDYMWRRLIVVSAEDCYGIMTKEIIALKLADDEVNKKAKKFQKDPLFAAKAVLLLCMARKNRDACYVACNFMNPDRVLTDEELANLDIGEYNEADLGVEGIPEWVFDVHTLKGKRMGKTDVDMTISEQAALKPFEPGLFDDCDWSNYYEWERGRGNMKDREYAQYQEFKKGKKLEPDSYTD